MLSNGHLKKQGTGQKGIIDLELVGTRDGARFILVDWGAQGRLIAGINLGMDYLYLVAYSSCISLANGLAAECLARRSELFGLVGIVLTWAQFGAALLDAAGNVAVIRLLLGSERAFWPPLARWCALPKFAIVCAGIAYFSIGGAEMVQRRHAAGAHGNLFALDT